MNKLTPQADNIRNPSLNFAPVITNVDLGSKSVGPYNKAYNQMT